MKIDKSFIKAKNLTDKLTAIRKDRQKLGLPQGVSCTA
jgi:hypothetical protein